MAEDKTDKKSIVTEAKRRFTRAKDHYSKSRKLAVEDTKFVMGDSDNGWQWPAEIRDGRESSKRVCLTVNMTAQHCNQIINNIRQNRPAVKVSPADDGADKETANILGGLIRQIQASSGSDEAHDTAAEHSVYGGEGYWRVITEYESAKSFDQVIRIVACPNPNNVYIDPDAKKADKSDAKWGMIFDDIPKETVKREYNVDPKQSFGDIDNEWVSEESVKVAEYFYCEPQEAKLFMLQDGTAVLESEMQPGAVVMLDEQGKPKQRTTTIEKWKWCKLIGGIDNPVDERDWLGRFLPIISVVGKEINVNGEVVRKGVVRDLKDPARMANYAFSETVQTLALQNKVPYIAAAEALEGHEDDWKNANTDTKAYLPWNAFNDNGEALPMPQRQPPAVMPAAQIQLLQLSTEQMRAASGQQNANFGIKSEASSGVGIQRLKAQGEIATFHFPDNLARALRYEAIVLIDLIQKYYDSKRVVRILGLDGKQESATLDPDQNEPYQEVPAGEDVQRIFNPAVGEYDVVIDTGPSFQTMRQEGAANLNDLAAKNPQLMQIAGDLIMRAQDFPYADKLADRLAKTLPPQLQDEQGQPQIPPQVSAQLQQLQQQVQQLGQALENAANHAQELEESQEMELKKLLISAYGEETKRIQALGTAMTPEAVQALVIQTLQGALSTPNPGQQVAEDIQEAEQEEPEQPGMQQPIPPPDPNQQIPAMNPPSAGFSLPEQA